MNKEIKNDIVSITDFPERLTAYNADAFEKELETLLVGCEDRKVIFDFSELEYIASSGLRIILRCAKRIPQLQIINMSGDVYEIFDTAGFASVMDIKRKRRQVSLKNARLIGEGYFSKVYRLDPETIIKVFIRDTSLEDIERELDYAKQAFILGVPTAISFDVVEAEGKLGVEFELLDGGSLGSRMAEHPEKIDRYIKQYLELMKKLNTTEAVSENIPRMKDISLKKLALFQSRIRAEEAQKLRCLLDTVPDRNYYVHGDLHIKNIMYSKDEPLVIDMDTLSKGNTIYELASCYATYHIFEELTAGSNQNFLGIKNEVADLILDSMQREYLAPLDQEEYDRSVLKIKLLAYFHMCFWITSNRRENEANFQAVYAKLQELMAQTEDLNIPVF